MTTVVSLVLVVGIVLLVAWIVLGVAADSVRGWEPHHPERRFGRAGRLVVAGLLGFGLGGISAAYAGWGSVFVLLAAIAGAAALGAAALRWGDPSPAGGS